MEIITILKANLRKKKGTFLSIVILMVLIATSTIAMINMRNNYTTAMQDALEAVDASDIFIIIDPKVLTKELCDDVENHKLVKRVRYYHALYTTQATVGEYTKNEHSFLMEMQKGIRLYNETLSGFSETIPELGEGEVYLPLGLKSILHCEVGDIVRYECLDGVYAFKIKGFVQEPIQGAANIGWKRVFISAKDYERIASAQRAIKDAAGEVTMMLIDKSDRCGLSDAKFQRQINLDTKIITNSIGALSKDVTIYYTGIFFEIIFYAFMVFVGFLFVIVLIVMSHSIATEIEIDFKDFGILKSLGYSERKIQSIMLLQYLSAQLFGILVGIVASVPLERMLSGILMQNTAILPDRGFSFGWSVLFTMLVLAVSAVVVFVRTRKLKQISPVRAIGGGKEDIWFDSRFRMPVSKRFLTVSLAFRQFMASKRRYASVILIVSILTFFMLSVNLLGNILTSRSALEAMGMDLADIDIRYRDTSDENYESEIEKVVESYSPIAKRYYVNSGYMSVNGEHLRFDCYQYPEYINAILKGRAPLYDNEIIITESVADMLEVEMGQEVTVANLDKEEVFLISGIYQSSNDSGMSFALSLAAAKKLGIEKIVYLGMGLENPDKKDVIVDALNEKFGDVIKATVYDLEKDMWLMDIAVNALKYVIYLFSVLFSLVVVKMVCSRTFVQERMDIGICKAIGFSTERLRLQFAVRFLFVALIGAILGTALSAALSERLLETILKYIGITRLHADYSPGAVLLPVAVVGICFFVFAYVVSRKIKTVAVRELVIE